MFFVSFQQIATAKKRISWRQHITRHFFRRCFGRLIAVEIADTAAILNLKQQFTRFVRRAQHTAALRISHQLVFLLVVLDNAHLQRRIGERRHEPDRAHTTVGVNQRAGALGGRVKLADLANAVLFLKRLPHLGAQTVAYCHAQSALSIGVVGFGGHGVSTHFSNVLQHSARVFAHIFAQRTCGKLLAQHHKRAVVQHRADADHAAGRMIQWQRRVRAITLFEAAQHRKAVRRE
mmetsp:Transcript_14815/g.25424  ORF Transcript_14815/g.25424 Transcript_14815/m.25424 type:complete len:234 (-) Transcript_14815:867-1568(-)